MTITSAPANVVRYLGKCPACLMGVALEGTAGRSTACPECGTRVTLSRVEGHLSDGLCDAACVYARGWKCECSCAGANHGGGWGLMRHRTPVPAEVVARITRTREQIAARAQAKREAAAAAARRGVEAFCDGASPLLAWLTYPEALDGDEFLEDVARRFVANGYLSDRQVDAVERAIVRGTERRDRDAARAARMVEAAKVSRYAGPVGSKVTVTGVVRVAMLQDAYAYGGTRPVFTVVEGIGDDLGVTVVTKGTGASLRDAVIGRVGEQVTVTGTVKDHAVREDMPQTWVKGAKATAL